MSEELKLNIPKMSCEGCIATITKSLEGIGLASPEFDLANKTVKIHGDNLNENEILKTLRRSNYPATVI